MCFFLNIIFSVFPPVKASSNTVALRASFGERWAERYAGPLTPSWCLLSAFGSGCFLYCSSL